MSWHVLFVIGGFFFFCFLINDEWNMPTQQKFMRNKWQNTNNIYDRKTLFYCGVRVWRRQVKENLLKAFLPLERKGFLFCLRSAILILLKKCNFSFFFCHVSLKIFLNLFIWLSSTSHFVFTFIKLRVLNSFIVLHLLMLEFLLESLHQ